MVRCWTLCSEEMCKKEWTTWPPAKPTATTPSSLLFDRNFGAIVEGAVMVKNIRRMWWGRIIILKSLADRFQYHFLQKNSRRRYVCKRTKQEGKDCQVYIIQMKRKQGTLSGRPSKQEMFPVVVWPHLPPKPAHRGRIVQGH